MANEPLADIRDMYVIHTVFRRELGLAANLVRGVTERDDERSGVVSEHLDLVLSLLHTHHSGEDAHIWPRLLERVPQELAPIVHTMESQHQGIEAAGTEVAAHLGAWRSSAAAAPREQLAAALERLDLAIREHLSLEEEKVLPIIGAHITAAEWNAMVQEDAANAPAEMLPLIFGMSMYEGDPEVIQMVVDSMPPDIGAVIKDVASQAYADHAKKVYGTGTPPRVGT